MGVQHFAWSLENDLWQEFVGATRKPTGYLDICLPADVGQEKVLGEVCAAAAQQMGRREVDADVVAEVFRRLAPGLLEHLDLPKSLPALAPRPVVLLNGELDDSMPVEGVEDCVEAAREAYATLGAEARLRFCACENVAVNPTPAMHVQADDWLARAHPFCLIPLPCNSPTKL
jgi:hypothetical protein